MTLAIFDLDDTIINGDCANLWSSEMARLGWVGDADAFVRQNDEMMRAYGEGLLTMDDYMKATLAPLARRRVVDVRHQIDAFVEQVIEPRIRPDARNVIDAHRQRGDTLLVISASSAHLVEPIAARVSINHVLAIDIQTEDGVYTGRTSGVLTYREGKVVRLRAWLKAHDESLAGASFYSDSRNDLPLLCEVDRPHVVNPDPALAAHANECGWPVLTWR
ncbi:HAD-IB family hydrolase [Paraburkholderia sprentiae WSM5005]|uniref:Histidinol-phosphatase n=1 Tax=Paraburkholderia sprentiae WSM5005 TaxID=754502 RepID=A0A1I9YN96_9BURK|nr:HAD family hydrolase [Paraburkholderia sprentiae]APA87779.1 HAD-IB family hydrolase [Paraburkholderia sprentiae WSM5005]